MRVVAPLMLAACATACGCVSGGIDEGTGSTADAVPDAVTLDTRDSAIASDTTTTPDTTTLVDSTSPPADTGKDGAPAESGTCKTDCLGVECGPIPNGCGGIVSCGDCGGAPGEYCVKVAAPIFQTGVHNAIEAFAATSPPYLDVTDVVGGGYRVKDVLAFRSALVAEMSKKAGLVCIGDPRDDTEIRVRPSTTDEAENYHVVISSGYTAYKYTSTCKPAGF